MSNWRLKTLYILIILNLVTIVFAISHDLYNINYYILFLISFIVTTIITFNTLNKYNPDSEEDFELLVNKHSLLYPIVDSSFFDSDWDLKIDQHKIIRQRIEEDIKAIELQEHKDDTQERLDYLKKNENHNQYIIDRCIAKKIQCEAFKKMFDN